jgi:hypothetical protein
MKKTLACALVFTFSFALAVAFAQAKTEGPAEELRNRTTGTTTSFQNINQNSSQLFNVLSRILQAFYGLRRIGLPGF